MIRYLGLILLLAIPSYSQIVSTTPITFTVIGATGPEGPPGQDIGFLNPGTTDFPLMPATNSSQIMYMPIEGCTVSYPTAISTNTIFDCGLVFIIMNADHTLSWSTNSIHTPFIPPPPPISTVTISGLTNEWDMSEGTGLTTADSAGSNNGILSGSPPPAWTTGESTGSFTLSFNGTSSYVSLASNPLSFSSFSICAWINPTNITFQPEANTEPRILNFYQDTNNWFNMGNYNGSFWVTLRENGVNYSGATQPILTNNTWTHVCATFDGASSLLFYYNGANVAYGGPWTEGSDPFNNIGARRPVDGFWEGDIDEVKVFNRNLSPSEVLSVFNE